MESDYIKRAVRDGMEDEGMRQLEESGVTLVDGRLVSYSVMFKRAIAVTCMGSRRGRPAELVDSDVAGIPIDGEVPEVGKSFSVSIVRNLTHEHDPQNDVQRYIVEEVLSDNVFMTKNHIYLIQKL